MSALRTIGPLEPRGISIPTAPEKSTRTARDAVAFFVEDRLVTALGAVPSSAVAGFVSGLFVGGDWFAEKIRAHDQGPATQIQRYMIVGGGLLTATLAAAAGVCIGFAAAGVALAGGKEAEKNFVNRVLS